MQINYMEKQEEKNENPHELNEKITNLLRIRNIQQKRIAKLLKTTPATVSRKLSSSKPILLNELMIISQLLGLEPADLMHSDLNTLAAIVPHTPEKIGDIGSMIGKKPTSAPSIRLLDSLQAETAIERHEELLSRLTRIERQLAHIIGKLENPN